MRPRDRLWLLALSLAISSSALGACQSLAGIDDRTYDPKGAVSTACRSYCAQVKAVCQDTNTQYVSDETCFGVCRLLPVGDSNEPIGNTLACRINQLTLAQQTGEASTLADYCARSGPGGNGTCGSTCESYCALYAEACGSTGVALFDAEVCAAKCQGLQDTHGFDVNANYFGDTLQCRLVHTSAATQDPETHCPHAQMPANGPCLGQDPATVVPDCDAFCQLELTECAGDKAVYESPEQCHKVCEALPKGTAVDHSGNTVACRKYHSYNALLDPTTHCPHTGPGGDGHCGSSATPDTGDTGNCDSYCLLLETACKSDFDKAFSDQASCAADCATLTGAGPSLEYSVADTTGNTLQCRLLHVSRALSDSSECAAAQGATPCN